MSKPFKAPPAYVVTSVDNALRIAAMLQLEGALTVTEIAYRIGVAPSTAHRLLSTLVYRDFVAQDEDRTYRVGPVLELAAHSHSAVAGLRSVGLSHLERLVDLFEESANLAIRTGDTVRFVASVESSKALRVGSREGMVFAAHRTTAGLVLLADLDDDQIEVLYAAEKYAERPGERPDLGALRRDLRRVRGSGFAINQGRSERGVVAVGVPVHGADGTLVAGLSVSMPSVRYDKQQLPTLVRTLRTTATALGRELVG